jgi:hypothetical protein
MSGQDAPSDEMPKFARQARLSREHEDLALDMLLDGMPLPPEAPSEMSALPSMLADLSGPAGPGELVGEAAALSRFRRHASPAGISSRRKPERRMPSWQSPARRGQLAAVLAAAAIGLGGTAAAYAGVLPSPVQAIAHRYLDAPAGASAPLRPGTNTGRAAHRHPVPPAGTGAARPVVPASHPNPTPALGHLSKPGPWLRNPHRHGHTTPPGQPDRQSPPARPAHPASPAHPQLPATSAPSGSGFRSYGPGGAGQVGPPGHGTSPGHSTPHGHDTDDPPAHARPRTR